MTNHPVRWFPSAIDRQHSRELAALDRRCDLAEEELADLGQLEARAHFEKMKAGALRREAKRLNPDGAEHYDMISAASTVGMVKVIDRFSRGR